MRERGFIESKFKWQAGYGVFSHGYKEKEVIMQYIINQEEHHKRKTFQKEYLQFLKSYSVAFQEEYLFDFNFEE